MSGLLPFQRAAVDRIVARLRDPGGTRRFLLADEVGLGKTLIASAVIEVLARDHPGSFTAVYVCSNQQIATQNRSKLAPPGTVEGQARRLTLLCLDLFRKRGASVLELHCFTPGTSLNLRSATGLQYERKLLLYLLDRMGETGHGRRSHAWSELFRCSCGEGRWWWACQKGRLAQGFAWASLPDSFVCAVRDTWAQRVLAADQRRPVLPGGGSLLEALQQAVESFDPWNRAWRRARNQIIGSLRTGLAMATLQQLNAGVVVLDEFQRFSSMLSQADDPNSVVGRLMGAASAGLGVPVLILSATPYKMLTLSFEDGRENHYERFLETLGFLLRAERDSATIGTLRTQLDRFGTLLRSPQAWEQQGCDVLLELRDEVQRTLTSVASRTERNWYLEDEAGGVEEVGLGGEEQRLAATPTVAELKDYLQLRRFLLERQLDDWKIMDFWKSCPTPLLFMDTHYSLIKRLRGHRRGGHRRPAVQVPRALVPRIRGPRDLARLEKRNARFRLLVPRVFGDAERGPPRAARFLWTRPTVLYQVDRFFGREDPSKFLLFSHWRMVPKAVSALLGQAAVHRLPGRAREHRTQPLAYRQASILLALWASPGLAAALDPLQQELIGPGRRRRSAEHIHRRAAQVLEGSIRKRAELKIDISPRRRGTSRVLRAMLRLDAHSGYARPLRAGLDRLVRSRETAQSLRELLGELRGWLDDDQPLVLSSEEVEELAHIALCSPAVCTLRASWTVLEDRATSIAPAVRLGLVGLRSFFSAPAAQRIVRSHAAGLERRAERGRANFARDVLLYCRDGHFQAVMDEYTWLVAETAQCTRAEGEHGLFDHLTRAMGMWTGRPQLNRLDAGGHLVEGPRVTAQFALAFGEEVSGGEGGERRSVQRSAVRDAFNSPFWPFVLATTSVGQEGLDFHLYCRDIVHWNLPANPVDLEQREGRINRYNGLFVRRNIAEDYPLAECLEQLEAHRPRRRGENLWEGVFRAVEARPQGLQRFKHGLYPHWIYRPGTDTAAARPLIRRHLLFYAASADERHYRRLKGLLATYRLAFGQPRQQDLLEDVLRNNPGLDLRAVAGRLRRYMVNLTPMDEDHVQAWVRQHAKAILAADRLELFVEELHREVLGPHAEDLAQVTGEVEWLIALVSDPTESLPRREEALYALVYLANPYDNAFDFLEGIGFDDDVEVIRSTVLDLGGA
jgi:hypothetical protein